MDDTLLSLADGFLLRSIAVTTVGAAVVGMAAVGVAAVGTAAAAAAAGSPAIMTTLMPTIDVGALII